LEILRNFCGVVKFEKRFKAKGKALQRSVAESGNALMALF